MLAFRDLKLHESVLQCIDTLGFKSMTPVQHATIPQFLAHKDVLVEVRSTSRSQVNNIITVEGLKSV
jgi:superfamily II DNA/RNA helicase